MQELRLSVYAGNSARTSVAGQTAGSDVVHAWPVAQCDRETAGGIDAWDTGLGAPLRKKALYEAGAAGRCGYIGTGRDVALPGEKTQKLWIWKVLDSVTGQLLEWECGDRGARTLKKLYGRIRHWNVQYYCTDEWEAYAKILPKEKLVMSKALTIGIEQNNGRQRHWFKRFGRKSIVVSKSREMVDLTIFLFAACHVNKTLNTISLFA
jgi:insertion element IS1 protein InsB